MWKKSDGKGLFPESPSQRAVARTWSTFIINSLVKSWYSLIFSKDEKEIETAKQKLAEDIKVLDEAMRSISEGPFFMGREFGVVDIMLAPHIERMPVLEKLKGLKCRTQQNCRDFKHGGMQLKLGQVINSRRAHWMTPLLVTRSW